MSVPVPSGRTGWRLWLGRGQGWYRGTPSSLKGVLLMLLATVMAAALHATVRYLTDTGLHAFQVAFFRNFFGLLALTPWIVSGGVMAALGTRRLGTHLLRAITNTVSMLMFFSGLSMAPLPQVQALSFTGPLFATLLAIALLGERIRLRRASALVVGFLGVMIIVRPGFQTVDLGTWLVLGAAALWGSTIIIIKLLSRTDSSVTITVYMGLLMSPLSLLPALLVWQWPDQRQWFWLVMAGILGMLAQLCMAQAFRLAEATALLPLDFLRLVWTSLIAYVLFNELIDGWTWLGGTVIFVSAPYIALRERRLKRGREA